MTTSQLVPVSPGTIGNVPCLIIDARSLHSALGVRSIFANWIARRITKYGFVEGQDFEVFSKNGKNSADGRPSQEYTLSIDMGKELCMVENNEAGRVARRYFIECERKLLASNNSERHSLQSSTITPDQQHILQSMVKALVARGGVYSNIWRSFNSHFHIGKYSQLPKKRMGEAVEYLMGFEADSQQKRLPPMGPGVKRKARELKAHIATVRESLCEFEAAVDNEVKCTFNGKNIAGCAFSIIAMKHTIGSVYELTNTLEAGCAAVCASMSAR